MRIGIIGGTGVYALGGSEAATVRTPYGEAAFSRVLHGEHELLFLPRHGTGHSLPPHRINYRANIAALRDAKCRCIIATNAVGTIDESLEPGSLVLPDQFIDFTKSRPLTFHDGEEGGVRHVDVTEPYCPALRRRASESLAALGPAVREGATYVCTEGPRFETPAEIRMFRLLGGDLVGMTGVPEVVLAREAGLCYMTLCIVTNYAAGISGRPLTEDEVGRIMDAAVGQVREAILATTENLGADWDCRCARPGDTD